MAAERVAALTAVPEEIAALRVLVIEDNTVEALAIQRELGARYELRLAATLAEALGVLAKGVWHPDVILANPTLPDSEGLATLRALQDHAGGIPIVVTTGAVTEGVRRQLEALVGAAAADRLGGPLTTRGNFLQHANAQSLMAYRIETIAEIDRVTRQAADAAVSRAIDELLDRLGLGDEEGLRMAVRLARGWEAAKMRFVSAVTTGLASAFLLALGAGIVAMMRQGSK
jgi:CheY-like chemotaxis protein